MQEASLPTTEQELREKMYRHINQRRPDRAILEWQMASKGGIRLESAHTYFQMALAFLLTKQLAPATDAIISARFCPDWSEDIQADFHRDSAFYHMKEGSYMLADEHLDICSDLRSRQPVLHLGKLAADTLAEARLMLYRGKLDEALKHVLDSQTTLCELYVNRDPHANEQYLLNASWWALIIAARCSNDRDVAQMLKNYRDGTLSETDPMRLKIVRIFGLAPLRPFRRALARLLIARSRK